MEILGRQIKETLPAEESLLVDQTAKMWNEIVADLKAWAAFAKDLQEASVSAR